MNNPDKFRNSYGQLWLNVGSSSYAIPGFVHLDNSVFLQMLPLYPLIRPLLNAQRRQGFERYAQATKVASYLVHECGQPLPFPSGSADHILASHFLEHLYKTDAHKVLRGFHDILTPNGTLHVIVPDLAALAHKYVHTHLSDSSNAAFVDSLILTKASKPSFLMRWREFVGGFGLLHRWMYDEASISALITSAGFTIEASNDSPSAHWRAEDNKWQVNILARKSMI
jgi:SAM-dependent methyltransferase